MGILRFILALSVVIFHAGACWGVKMVQGQVAVQAFYLISGFYMALILNGKYPGKL
jgi:peptidoglycan/LPS O-acetylase OafA/YrhL